MKKFMRLGQKPAPGKRMEAALRDMGRVAYSVITYVGHNIIGKRGYTGVRVASNTVNLDVGAYSNNAILIANHKKGTVEWCCNNSPRAKLVALTDITAEHLAKQKPLPDFLRAVRQCTRYAEFEKLTDNFCKSHPEFIKKDLLEAAVHHQALSDELITNGLRRHAIELINAGLDPNYIYTNGDSLLSAAVKMEELPLITLLLKQGADPLYVNPRNETIAAIAKDTEEDEIIEIIALAQAGAAVKTNNLELLTQILSEGIEITEKQIDGKSLLTIAREADHLAGFLTYLIDYVKSGDKLSRVEVQELFKTETLNPIEYAVKEGNIGLLRGLLDIQLFDVNATNHTQTSPLHFAIINGKHEALELLIAKGADIEQLMQGMLTPLHLAAIRHDPDSFKILMEHGASAKQNISMTEDDFDHLFRRDDKATQTRAEEFFKRRHDKDDNVSVSPLDIAIIKGTQGIISLCKTETPNPQPEHSPTGLRK